MSDVKKIATRESYGNALKELGEKKENLVVLDAVADMEKVAASVDFVFCAVDMKKDEIKALEEAYAKLECPVVSNNSAPGQTY